jgi:hypothetical protein
MYGIIVRLKVGGRFVIRRQWLCIVQQKMVVRWLEKKVCRKSAALEFCERSSSAIAVTHAGAEQVSTCVKPTREVETGNANSDATESPS